MPGIFEKITLKMLIVKSIFADEIEMEQSKKSTNRYNLSLVLFPNAS